MMMSLAVLMAAVASLVLPVAAVVGIVTYVRRTRRLERMEADGSPFARMLDSLDQVHVRLDALNERMSRIERRLEGEPGRTTEALEPDPDERTPRRGIGR